MLGSELSGLLREGSVHALLCVGRVCYRVRSERFRIGRLDRLGEAEFD